MRARLPFGRSGRTAPLLLPPLIVLTALASGCGGTSHTASNATTTTVAGRAGTNAGGGRAQFTACLEAHGVPASEATQGFGFRRPSTSTSTGASDTSTPPTTSAAFASAFQACRSELPARPVNGGLQNTAAGRAYLQCLQLHGVTLPSTPPTTTPGGTAGGSGGNFRSLTSDPAYPAARSACAALAPTRSSPDGTGSSSATTAG